MENNFIVSESEKRARELEREREREREAGILFTEVTKKFLFQKWVAEMYVHYVQLKMAHHSQCSSIATLREASKI